MSKVYDNWEKLVGAVLKREQLKQLAICESFSTSTSSDFSFDLLLEDLPHVSRISGETIVAAGHASRLGVQPLKYKEIKKATGNFHPYMWSGQGAFGPVYKGWIDLRSLKASKKNSGTAVAVKQWAGHNTHGRIEWLSEIEYLSQLHQPNLVKLIGYCSEEDNLILVYEFMPKGSLANHLLGRGHQTLSWTTRIKVAIGAAKALSFLHELPTPVIHRGCQCNNILLDGEFNAKLSDFGLARDGPTGDMTHISTVVRGTYGIAAPEYISTGHLTVKCDVYGFGVVLIEILSGRRATDRIMGGTNEQTVVEWAKHSLENRAVARIMDTKLDGKYPITRAYTVWKLAFQCLSEVPRERPTMADVVFTLQNL